ncbi:MAG: hypothetical protein KDI98_03135 [Hyphomicrobiaceae bacterium]|nr:hypothetical protein [Hyphomicrobiaceae bacterium]
MTSTAGALAPLNMARVVSLAAMLITLAAEFAAIAIVTGWALAGLFGLPLLVEEGIDAALCLVGLAALVAFYRSARLSEPLRGV